MAGLILLAGLLLATTLSCSAPGIRVAPAPLPADGAGLLAVLAAEPAEGWELFPGRREYYPGAGPHGILVSVRVNRAALLGLTSRSATLPSGSVIVCQGFDDNRNFSGMVVMAKIAGYAPDAGDWFWVAYDPAGGVVSEGRQASCSGCHRKVGSNDMVFTGPIR